MKLRVSRSHGNGMTEYEIDREVKRRLAIFSHAEEVTGNVTMTCRYYGITRQTFYIWKRRYEEFGEDGLRPRSRRPKVSPNATQVDVVGKIIYLRKNYHFGPTKIAMYLERYHDVSISNSSVGSATCWPNSSSMPANTSSMCRPRWPRGCGCWERGSRTRTTATTPARWRSPPSGHPGSGPSNQQTMPRCCGPGQTQPGHRRSSDQVGVPPPSGNRIPRPRWNCQGTQRF